MCVCAFRHELCAEDIDENRIAEDATVSTRLGGFEGISDFLFPAPHVEFFYLSSGNLFRGYPRSRGFRLQD